MKLVMSWRTIKDCKEVERLIKRKDENSSLGFVEEKKTVSKNRYQGFKNQLSDAVKLLS